jgi:putative hemolysin
LVFDQSLDHATNLQGSAMVAFILVLLIVANGVFAMSEIAVVSARRSRLRPAAERGNARAAAALALAESPARFLSTVQIGITLIGILAGALGEAAITADLAGVFQRSPALAPYSHGLALAIVVLGITYLSLVVGELVPKRIGLAQPERVAAVMARPMIWLSRATAPAVWLLTASSDLLVRVFGAGREHRHTVTDEDIKGMVQQAAETGTLHKAEEEMVAGVLRLGDLKVKALMVPRADIEWLDAADSPARIRVAVATSLHSQYPVCRGGLDDIVGVLHVKDVIKHGLVSETINLAEIARPPLFVPETTPALKVLETFKHKGVHMALVVDEYGAVEGLITFNDIVESVIGEVYRPGQEAEPLIIRRDEHSWLLDGSLPVDQLQDVLGTDSLPTVAAAAEGVDYHTLGGLVMARLGHIPQSGESFEWNGFRFEVVDMDKQRVDKVLLVKLPEPLAEGESAVAGVRK